MYRMITRMDQRGEALRPAALDILPWRPARLIGSIHGGKVGDSADGSDDSVAALVGSEPGMKRWLNPAQAT
jgi:hypothetical protein